MEVHILSMNYYFTISRYSGSDPSGVVSFKVGTCKVFLALEGEGVGARVVGGGGRGSKRIDVKSELDAVGEVVVLVAGVGIGCLVEGKLAGSRLNKFKGESLGRFLVCVEGRTLTLATYVRE